MTRGTEGIKLRKTKGHALDPPNRKWLAEHPELRDEGLHNKRADRLADEARDFYFTPTFDDFRTCLFTGTISTFVSYVPSCPSLGECTKHRRSFGRHKLLLGYIQTDPY